MELTCALPFKGFVVYPLVSRDDSRAIVLKSHPLRKGEKKGNGTFKVTFWDGGKGKIQFKVTPWDGGKGNIQFKVTPWDGGKGKGVLCLTVTPWDWGRKYREGTNIL